MRTWLALVVLMFLGLGRAEAQNPDAYQLIVLGGVFSPVDEVMQGAYGDGFMGQIALGIPFTEELRLRLGVSHFRRSGDPFYQFDDFDVGRAGQLTLTGIIFGLEHNTIESGYAGRLQWGVELEYVRGSEELFDRENSRGSGMGLRFSLAPEFSVSSRVSLVLEGSYRFLTLHLRRDRDRYRFDLSGASLLAGLEIGFGR